MDFEQATIKIHKEREFAELQAALQDAFQPERVKRFLKQLDRKGIRIRDFDGVLKEKALEAVGAKLDAKQLYDSLAFSDQAQIRELYLSKIETVDAALRREFKKLYQYY